MALTQLTKIDGGGISTTSDYRVGVITASKFVGPFDGTGGNFSGVVTATNGVFSGNISAVDGNFSGNVTIGGTLTYEDVTNIDSVGIITAQSDIHVGGGVSAVGVGTFGSLDIGGDIDVDGHTNLDNLNVAGVSTFTGEIDHNSTLTTVKLKVNSTNAQIDLTSGQASFTRYGAINHYHNNSTSTIHNQIKLAPRNGGTGRIMFYNLGGGSLTEKFRIDGTDGVQTLNDTNLSVAGNTTLTRDLDVDGHTNLDNVSIAGVVTATDFKAPDGNTNGFYAGNSDDLHLFHNGADSYIENDTGNLTFTNKNSNNIIFKTTSSEVEKVRITSAGSVGVGTNNPNVGNSAYPVVQVHSTETNAYFKLTNTTTGVAPTDGVELSLSGSDAYLTNRENANIIFRTNNGSSTGERLRITSDGKVGINQSSPNAMLQVDYDEGNSEVGLRLRAYNASGSKTWQLSEINGNAGVFTIRNATNSINALNITSTGDVGIGYGSPTVKLHIREAASGYSGTYDNRYHCIIEDDAEAYYGIYVPDNGYGGIRFADTTGLEAYIDYYFGNDEMHFASGDKHIFKIANVERLRIDPAGNLVLKDHLAQGNSLVNYIQANDVNGASQYILGQVSTGNQDLYLQQSKNANLRFQTNASTRWKIDGNPGHLLPEVAGAVNIGSASAEIGDVYLADGKSVYLGSDQDVRIFYDASGSASFTIDANAGYTYINSDALRLNSKTSGWNYLRGDKSDGVVKLYKSNSQKLATSDTGITVTGEVAASQDYPNLKPTLDLNFTATANLDPRVTFTRIGSGSYYGRDGLLKFAAHNEPRFDHDPITRECKGLLIEEQRENWAYNSYRANNDYGGGGATFADMGYNMINNAVTINDFGTAPDGTNTATKMYPASSGGARGIELQMSLSSTGNWTNSIYVKAAGHTGWIALYGVNGGARAYFNPSTGAKGSSGGTAAPSSDKYGIQDVGNGWYRIHITINLTTTGGTEYHYIYFGDSDNSTNVTASGTNGILMWGLQVEKGDYPTSYIRTDSNHRVIRGADQCFINGQDLTNFYNQSEGTIIADYKVIQGDPEIFYLSNNTSSKRIGLYEAGSSQTRFIIGNSGTQADTTDSAGTTVGDNIKSSGAYKLNDIVAAKNGVISSTDSSATIPDGIDRAWIGGYYDGTVQGVLGLRRLIYYPQRLPNSQLVTLTS